ncbi:MAG TPA: nucleoside monophosphate kinase [Lacunisphaera sp.]|jgi:adenylate kinase|nr:nucleoside monophosphate kinase [Lacunisphaera sp.]
MKSPRDHTAWLLGGNATCRLPPLRPLHPRRIVLLGPPGIGKGTQAKLLGAALGACDISTAEVVRSARSTPGCATQPALRLALNYARRGESVPEEALLAIVNERCRCLRCAGGFILDGFPRTLRHAEALDLLLAEQGLALDAVIRYELPAAEIVPRLLGRRICPTCREIYHVKDRPPHVAGRCDECNSALVQRREDRIDSIRLMQGTYAMSPQSLIRFYRERSLLVNVTAQGTPEEVFNRTIEALAQVSAARPAWNPAELVHPGVTAIHPAGTAGA